MFINSPRYTTSVYGKFGDVNPIEHGGGFFKKESDTEFEIIHITPDQEREGMGWWNIVDVDTEDSGLEVESICSYAGIEPENVNTIEFALACIDYYGIENFGGNLISENGMSPRNIEKLYNTIVSENFIDDETTIRCRIVNYFDVWGNAKDGYEVNNQCYEGELTVPKDASDRDIVDALKKFGFFKKNVRMNMFQFESAYIDIWMINDSKGKPVCCVEPIIDSVSSTIIL